MGIIHTIGLPSQEVERLEGQRTKTIPTTFNSNGTSAGMTLENWQMAHFRVLGE